MKLGIVGLPNVGKSTLFNAITNAGAESANYPFCTIEPNVGMVAVPDERLDKLTEMYHPKKKTPAVIEFVDIAGLVKGASQGAGLGNKFLENIRRTDAIVHVVRCFDDENIMHVVADASTNVPVDPLGDIETIDLELIMADLEMVNRRVEKATKMAKGDKKFLHEVELFSALAKHLDAGKSARTFEVSSDDAELIATADLLSLKPIIYAANMDEDGFVYLDARIKRMIIRHDGFKVFPSMIENVVSQHPAVHQCSVVGCADKEHVQGRLPFVYLVLDPAVPAAKRKQIIKELRQLCIEELPEYVQPVGYKIIPEMPLTLAAKFDYRKLEEEITPRDY